MCADENFRVIVNLSNFFHDDRRKARIFINEDIRKIRDLEERIKTIFDLNKIHLLTSQDEFLPPSEDVRILRNDEIVCVKQNEDPYDKSTCTPGIEKASEERHISPTQECTRECTDKTEGNLLVAGVSGNNSVGVDNLNNGVNYLEMKKQRNRKRNKRKSDRRFKEISAQLALVPEPLDVEEPEYAPVLLDDEYGPEIKDIIIKGIVFKGVMLERKPKVNDLMAFTIEIKHKNGSPSWTPEAIGKVVEYDKESDKVYFEMLNGIEHHNMPRTMVPVEEDFAYGAVRPNQRKFRCDELIEAWLIEFSDSTERAIFDSLFQV